MPHIHPTREQTLAILLILFALWCGISWRWYTCGVKGFCDGADDKKAATEVRETPLIALAVAEAAPEVPPTPTIKSKRSIPTPTKPTPTLVTTPSFIAPTAAIVPSEVVSQKKTENCSTYINKKVAISVRNDPALVSKLERFMNRVAGEPLAEDGMFGPNDVAAVKSYQRSQNLSPTGVVDQETAFYINKDVCSFPGSLLE